MPEPFTTLLLSHDGPIATVTLHRPEVLHALNATMFTELDEAFRILAADVAVRVILVTGSGERAFAAGADIRGLESLDANSGLPFSERGQRVFNAVERCGKPTLALVNGVALGGGCELALACTFRIASETARLGLPELKLGLVPGYGGTQRLPRLIGRSAALKLILTGEFVSAAEAHRLGLVDEVVAADRLLARGQEFAAAIASMAPLAIGAALQAVRDGLEQPLDEGLAMEAAAFANLCGSHDKNEGVAAFLGKRTPAWQGN